MTSTAPAERSTRAAAGRATSVAPARRLRRRRALTGMLYATPTAVFVGGLFVLPLLLVGWMSLHHWPLLGAPTLNAPDNYTAIGDEQLIRSATWFTLKYTVIITVLLFVLSFGMALLVRGSGPARRFSGTGLLRGAYMLPMAVGFASASLLFLGLLSDEIGPVSDTLSALGLVHGYVSWTSGSPGSALGANVVLVLWRFAGFNMLILLTGLQAIPTELYEAARIDGAGRWATFRRITVPLMRPTISLVLILMVSGSLLAFDQFFILTRGGPDDSTTSLVMVVYRAAFVRLDLGGAAAISVLLLLAVLALNAIQLRFLRRED